VSVQVTECVTKSVALRELLEYLKTGSLVVGAHSCVASAIGSWASNRVMSSAVHTALQEGWIVRSREHDVRDHYENPITLRITYKGRKELTPHTT